MLARPTVQRLIVILMLVTAFIGGCSFRTLYNQLDYLIPEYVDDMVSLDEALESLVEQRSLALIDWHRSTQLLQYADWLREVQAGVAGNIDEQRVLQRIDEINAFWQQLARQINDELARLLPLLDKEQQNELFASLAERNEEFRDEYVDIDESERIEAYLDSMQDNFEDWLGDLTEKQNTELERAAKALQSTAELRLLRRIAWQQGVRKILQSDQPLARRQLKLREFVAEFEVMDNPVMQQRTAHNRKALARTIVAVQKSMTAAQQDHFMTHSDDYIRMFTELAGEADEMDASDRPDKA